jgi:hypothetical protein
MGGSDGDVDSAERFKLTLPRPHWPSLPCSEADHGPIGLRHDHDRAAERIRDVLPVEELRQIVTIERPRPVAKRRL